jgi:hypothetical protein
MPAKTKTQAFSSRTCFFLLLPIAAGQTEYLIKLSINQKAALGVTVARETQASTYEQKRALDHLCLPHP